MIADVYGLQGIGSAGMLGNSFALGGYIDASGTSNWNNGAGFAPIGDGSLAFTGTFDGGGYAISGLVIDLPAATAAGLFGNMSGTIRSVRLIGGSVTGGDNVGSLTGISSGSIEGVRTMLV